MDGFGHTFLKPLGVLTNAPLTNCAILLCLTVSI